MECLLHPLTQGLGADPPFTNKKTEAQNDEGISEG